MILQALVQLAENEKLIADPDFEFKPVAWVVRLKEDGTVLAIEDNRQNLNEGLKDRKDKPLKPKWVGREVLIPLFPTGRAGTKPKAAFLVDMAKFVFGREPLQETNDGSLTPYVERFRTLVANCEADTHDPAVAAARKMLDRILAGEPVAALPAETGPSDLFMFRVGDDPLPVHARPSVTAFWKQLRAAVPDDVDLDEWTTCLVTGVPIVGKPPLFPLIKGVPGAGAMGSGLLPFNGPSSRTWSSYGLEGNENAPVSRLAAEAAATALNRLADLRPTSGHSKPLPVRRIKLNSDTIIVFWSPEPAAEVQNVLDTLPVLIDVPGFAPADTLADVGNLIASYRTGAFKPLREPARFYAMTVTGTTGRIVVRDWFEDTVADVQKNVGDYFADLTVMRPDGSNGASRLSPVTAPTFRNLSLAGYREIKDVPPSFGQDWFRLILKGRSVCVPSVFVQRVVNRIKIELSGGGGMTATAAAVLQLHLARSKDAHMTSYLNEDHPNPAYHCGRMLAVLDFAQQRAINKSNTTNVRRMLGAIVTAPALYLARVRKLTEIAYLPKLKGTWPKYLQRRIQTIGSRIKDEMPRLLRLQDQSTFFLGMDHERSYLDTHPAEKYRICAVNGEWVQSAGEANVIRALMKLGYDFDYEPGLKLGATAYRVPDFMIGAPLVEDRVFIEYLGMREVKDYEKRWQQKRTEFEAFGLRPIEDGGGPQGKLIAIDGDGRDYVGILSVLEKHLGPANAEPANDIDEPEGES